MYRIFPDRRQSGLALVGDLTWGTDFCQFYKSADDLIEILAPYFKAGLENNELCIFIPSDSISVDHFQRHLTRLIPHFEEYIKHKQMDIISPKSEYSGEKGIPKAISAAIDNALSGGFEGIRMACDRMIESRTGSEQLIAIKSI